MSLNKRLKALSKQGIEDGLLRQMAYLEGIDNRTLSTSVNDAIRKRETEIAALKDFNLMVHLGLL